MNFVACAIAALCQIVLRTDFETIDTAQAEVRHTGNSIRTINGRGTAGDDVDRINQERRDGVKVDDLGGIEEHPAAAVHKNEVTVRPETAKVQGSRTITRIVRERRCTRNDLRQRIDYVFDVDRTGEGEFLILNNGDGRSRFDVAACDARTGYDDRCAGFRRLGRLGARFVDLVVGLRESRSSGKRPNHHRARQKHLFGETIRHSSPLVNKDTAKASGPKCDSSFARMDGG